MNHQMHGDHTWEIIIEYLRCPHCGLIIENRDLNKTVECPRCKNHFTLSEGHGKV